MAMLKPSQSYSGGFIVDPYTGNIAQEMQFLSGEDRKKKTNPILRLGSPWQPSNKRLEKPALGCLFELLIRKRFNFLETVSSIHLNLQFEFRSVREVCKDLNIMSSSLSADRVECERELIKGSYEQTRECIW